MSMKMHRDGFLCLAFICIVVLCQADPDLSENSETSHVNLDLANEAVTNAKHLLQTCVTTSVNPVNSLECGVKAKSSAFMNVAMNFISEAKENHPGSGNEIQFVKDEHPKDCAELYENGHTLNGVYNIWPRHRLAGEQSGTKSYYVFCDMETDGGGWTVIQRRGNFTNQQDFHKDWNAYKKGFGELTRDFWLGNENIYALSNQKDYTLRFDMQNPQGEKRFAEYDSFWIESEEDKYRAHFGDYHGTAGDGFEQSRGIAFTTRDRENSMRDRKCHELKKGGWWYWDCGLSNPNGIYQPTVREEQKSVNWHPFTVYGPLHSIEMKLKQKSKH